MVLERCQSRSKQPGAGQLAPVTILGPANQPSRKSYRTIRGMDLPELCIRHRSPCASNCCLQALTPPLPNLDLLVLSDKVELAVLIAADQTTLQHPQAR
jgi:hypothetical protein